MWARCHVSLHNVYIIMLRCSTAGYVVVLAVALIVSDPPMAQWRRLENTSISSSPTKSSKSSSRHKSTEMLVTGTSQ